MEYSKFEEQICRLVPDFILKQFSHLLKAIPEIARNEFVSLVEQHQDIMKALDWIAFSGGVKSQDILEYAHWRMQDNMSEIMD
ncbi:MAG TPA: hypothetical protein PL009_02665 [Flavipsychrobacter sp.]|nr:hypothetical protein [Flavipsychrobacter sp.]